jgi:hypothetical protein
MKIYGFHSPSVTIPGTNADSNEQRVRKIGEANRMSLEASVSDPTFYHYKLVRKILLKPESKYSYMATAVIGMAALVIVYGQMGLLGAAVSLVCMLAIHAFVLKITVRRIDEPYPWSGSLWTVSLLYWHLWLLSPRLRLLWRLRREKGDGVIRLDSKEVLYFHR